MNSRRNFVKKAGASLLLMGTSSTFFSGNTYGNNLQEKNEKNTKNQKDLFKISFAGYSFRHLDIDSTLSIMDQLDVRYLCVKDFHLPLKSTDEEIAAFKAKLAAKKITGYAVGPIYMKSEEEINNSFDYAKRVGVNLIVGVPNYELLPYVEKKVKEYDVKYAIHIHGPDMKLYPNVEDVMSHIKNLDSRIGICLDIAHDTRYGSNPVLDLQKYYKRVFDVHINDALGVGKEGKLCVLGRGIVDVQGFIQMLRKVKYDGACSIEMVTKKDNTLAIVAESAGYFKGMLNAKF